MKLTEGSGSRGEAEVCRNPSSTAADPTEEFDDFLGFFLEFLHERLGGKGERSTAVLWSCSPELEVAGIAEICHRPRKLGLAFWGRNGGEKRS